MKHEKARVLFARALVSALQSGYLEVYEGKDDKEPSMRGVFSLVELDGEHVISTVRSEPVRKDTKPTRFLCRDTAGDVVLSGTAGPNKELDCPAVVKEGGIATFKFRYRPPL